MYTQSKMSTQHLEEELAEIERRIELLESAVSQIQARNVRVEADKAWEISWYRVVLLSLLTYVVAAAVLYGIGVTNYLLSGLIPTLGFFLSTLSLPIVKKFWLRSHNTQELYGENE